MIITDKKIKAQGLLRPQTFSRELQLSIVNCQLSITASHEPRYGGFAIRPNGKMVHVCPEGLLQYLCQETASSFVLFFQILVICFATVQVVIGNGFPGTKQTEDNIWHRVRCCNLASSNEAKKELLNDCTEIQSLLIGIYLCLIIYFVINGNIHFRTIFHEQICKDKNKSPNRQMGRTIFCERIR